MCVHGNEGHRLANSRLTHHAALIHDSSFNSEAWEMGPCDARRIRKEKGKRRKKKEESCVWVGGHSWEAEHVFLLLFPFLLPRPLPTSGQRVHRDYTGAV